MRNLKPSLFGKMLLLCAALLAVCVPRTSATVTNYVGGCAGSPNFTTITAALATSPAPNLVEVCPGTYAEQVVITKPVKLEGILTSNADQVVITVPSGGLSVTTPCATEGAAQVCAAGAGSINITNITVDGTGGVEPVGIAYNNASGTVNQVETRNQGTDGVGIYLVGAANTVTVENSNLYGFGLFGILVEDGSETGSEFTVKLEKNTLVPDSTADAAILFLEGKSVTVSGNAINGPSAPPCSGSGCGGIVAYTPVAGSITKNKVFGVGSGGVGIYVGAGVGTISVTSNTVFDIAGDGIQLNTTGLTVTDNNLMQVQNGIDLECNVNSGVTSNTMTAVHTVGLANVPSGAVPVNVYYDAPTLYSTCP